MKLTGKQLWSQILKNSGLKFLFYDIETLPLGSNHFQLGPTVLNHKALQPGRDRYQIICIQYKWAHEKKVQLLSWIGENKKEEDIIREFDKVVSQADILIGKNSDRFDTKQINTIRMLNDLPPAPDWVTTTHSDDLEKQMRKHFYLPSNSLDYFSKLLGVGGKDKMEFSDWIDIRNYEEVLRLIKGRVTPKSLEVVTNLYYKSTPKNILSKGKAALTKMYTYGKKDVADTEFCWVKALPYIKPKLNVGRQIGNKGGTYLRCVKCGSDSLRKNNKRVINSVVKQRWECKSCGYVGNKSTILKNGTYGKME